MSKVLSEIRIRRDVCVCGAPFDRVGMDLTGATYSCRTGHWTRIEYGLLGEKPPAWKDPRLASMERSPKYTFGDVLVSQRGFRGRVTMMFEDYKAVLSAGIVQEAWFEIQSVPPSTKDQVFYHLVGDGAVLAGELDVCPEKVARQSTKK